MSKYSIGVDFGTLSCRALLVDVSDGREIMSFSSSYAHAVIDEVMPSGKKLPQDYALQHPQDYIDSMSHVLGEIWKAGVSPADVIGVATDFTACTLIPVYADGKPLCFNEKYSDNPHAYIKLWKHHAAQKYATKINETAEALGEKWLSRYGGKISSEWLFAKLWQVLEEAPEVYSDAAFFIEAADWIVWQLTGMQTRNSCTAGYKAIWHKKDGYPSKQFFSKLNPKLENVVKDKLDCPVSPLGTKAGEVTETAAALFGLAKGTAVAVGNVDAHVTVPAARISKPGDLLAIMGTSTCHMILGSSEKIVPGMCGVVEDGILPGLFGYEAGQSCVGDHFAWFVENFVSEEYKKDAADKGYKDIYSYLADRAKDLRAGESGIIALDWWNGNRSVLVDIDLTGLFIGMTLRTKPEELYRALIEATAYGTRMIIETFRENGVGIQRFFAAGGISVKEPFVMQTYADITGLEIKIAGSAQAPALGSAIFGAVAAGKARGGYDSVYEASEIMGSLSEITYKPIPKNSAIYDRLYAEYRLLHDYFGRGGNDVMKRLKAIKESL